MRAIAFLRAKRLKRGSQVSREICRLLPRRKVVIRAFEFAPLTATLVRSRCIACEYQIVFCYLLVARKASLHECVIDRFAVAVEVTESPTSGSRILLRILNHKLNVRRGAGDE